MDSIYLKDESLDLPASARWPTAPSCRFIGPRL